MRWAKVLGVAGVVAVLGATGVAVYQHRRRRRWAEVPPDELRTRLHARLAAARAEGRVSLSAVASTPTAAPS